MGAFVGPDEIDRIDLGEGEWADIRRRYPYGLRRQLGASSPVDKFLMLAVVAWNITGADGKVLPLTVDSLDLIDTRVAALLAEEIAKRAAPLAQIGRSTPLSGAISPAPVTGSPRNIEITL